MEALFNYEYRGSDLAPMPLKELALFVLERQQAPKNSQVSVTFVDDVQMAQLNEDFRGKRGPTDVLSFECDGLDDGFLKDAADTLSVPFELGDIVIAPDVAARQSIEFNHSLEAEVSLLLVHGLLHLMGYDHIEDDEAECMEARERQLLDEWARSGHPAVQGVCDDTIRVRGEH